MVNLVDFTHNKKRSDLCLFDVGTGVEDVLTKYDPFEKLSAFTELLP